LDKAALQAVAPAGRFTVIPNGVDTRYFTPRDESSDPLVVFVGAADWFPNLDGMNYLGEHILPELRRLYPEVRVRWIGRVSDPVRVRMRERFGIEMTGHLADLRDDLGRALCVVVPLRIGSGSRVKILDAWAMGKTVVSTSLGCEGLPARQGVNILIRDDSEDFARAVDSVLRDTGLRVRIGSAAHATVQHEFDWDTIGAELRAGLASFHGGVLQ